MSPTISIQLARTCAEFEAAYRLQQQARERWNLTEPTGDPCALFLTKHHALPSTNTIVAVQSGQVIASICLFGESAFVLPMENTVNLAAFRANLEGRLAEISLPGFAAGYDNDDILYALYHFAACFGATYCNYDGCVAEATPAWADHYSSTLGFQPIFDLSHGRKALFLNVRETVDYRQRLSPGFSPEFKFPDKKFFLVAHQSMSPEVLHYLFHKRTRLFEKLSDLELRVLKNIYDYGDYAKVLPDRPLSLPFKAIPKRPRFPMNCEGFLVSAKGERVHLQVIDVSHEGLKFRAEATIRPGTSFALTLHIGVKQKTEVIVETVWVDDKAQIAGVQIKSADDPWHCLITYLEKDFLRVAA